MKRSISDVLGKDALSSFTEDKKDKKSKNTKGDYGSGHWNQGLKVAMSDPELKVYETEETVIIRDKFPKAKFHYLVLPKKEIKNLQSLSKKHLRIVKLMHRAAVDQIKRLKDGNPTLNFKVGYHAVPSMSQLHLHVISQDFNSPCLKTKKHWNSFTSDFFRPSLDIIEELETFGKVSIDKDYYEQHLKNSLRCHICKDQFPTMPKLKQHIQKHEATWRAPADKNYEHL